MNKNDIINEVHKAGTGTASKDQITAIVNKTFSVMGSALAAGDDVKVNDFGNFSVKERGERPGRNPATGEEITIKASKSVGFKAAKHLKDSL